ncbi:MAG: tyrosine-type recombinase/integrase [Candidatus Melainabacteria bacterium]|nr:tyrosine-type recombinase/integrase [Candidatus Melainabacteria bacterium]
MNEQDNIGWILHSFFVDHLPVQRGLRPSSVKSYRDVLRLFIQYISAKNGKSVVRLQIADFTYEEVLGFLQTIEEQRHNGSRSRNHRLAAIHKFFKYVAIRVPEMILQAERVAAIPTKRSPPAQTFFLETDSIKELFAGLPSHGRRAARDRALLLFLYNTGARVQEVADLRTDHLDLGTQPRVHLHGKGDKWRVCPLWQETVCSLKHLLSDGQTESGEPVFRSSNGRALTRFGIYKIVRRLTETIELSQTSKGGSRSRHISPHIFRHSTAMHLLESGVEINVIRAWLGHVSLDTTHRYAEINIRVKAEALEACELRSPMQSIKKWNDDKQMMDWLDSL